MVRLVAGPVRVASLVVSTVVIATGAFGQSDPAERREMTIVKKKPSELLLTGELGVGAGSFQDIQVPVDVSAQQRIDGTVAQTENATHAGFPLWGGLGLAYKTPATTLDVRLDIMQMRATSGPAETQGSSYSRFELGTGASYALPLGAVSLVGGGRLSARRSSFNNVSNGHYIEAIMVRGSLGLLEHGREYSFYGAVAPQAKFGYANNVGLGITSGDQLADSKATLNEVGALARFPLSEDAWLDLGVDRESAHVTISDVATAYAGFGLNPADVDRPTREYELATTVFRIGLRKAF